MSRIWGVEISKLDIAGTLRQIDCWVAAGEKKHIVTANSEMLYNALSNPDLADALQNADMVTPDGIGVVWAAAYIKEPVAERVPGCDIMNNILGSGKNYSVYFLGSTDEVLKEAQVVVEKKFPAIRILGSHNGYFTDSSAIIAEINAKRPQFLFVGMGSPKQELWIKNNLPALDVNIAIGIGGSLDVLAGKVQRAPQIWIDWRLEWLYRLIKEPHRFWRMTALPKFVLRILMTKGKNRG